ncbi:glycosyltransferase family 4 protein [Marinilongibacter aquaticus]|uniref:glycosyltransferase family 4 protein n=1 Tax=Marinilongibacter aquaticus TaxID=2975157 RepID=UPI0021BD7088|nr:glycosyltransferase family 4 protein [Marinilongibacter aquaticus]UBM57909.1 glycosyltransferase family 4 protein [Marinilongibacter aquaticus]
MKIAIISIVFPFPIDSGGSAGTFNLIEHARKSHDITFFCPNVPENRKEGLQKLWPNVEIITTEPNKPESFSLKLFKKALSLKQWFTNSTPDYFYPKTHLAINDLSRCHYPGFLELVQEHLMQGQFDLIQVEYIEFAAFAHVLPPKTPKVFIHHELRYRRLEMEYATLKHKTQNDLLHIRATKDLEIALLNHYDKVVTVSEQDKLNLIEAGVKADKITASPSPISIKMKAINQPFEFKNKLVFLGPEAHYPNLDAVNWFLETAWPQIHAKHPELTFQIVSKWSEEFKSLQSDKPNVEFLGFVEDLSTVFDGAILVVPLRIVSGMRMKILEGISWRVPIVSTSDGAEGLPMKDGVNCMIANDPDTFVQKVNALIESPELANRLLENSQEVTLKQYNFEHCGEVRNAIYSSIKEENLINASC